MAITRIPDGLKLNRFELAVLPHARKVVNTFGYASSPANLYSGEFVSPSAMDKVHVIKAGLDSLTEDCNNSKD